MEKTQHKENVEDELILDGRKRQSLLKATNPCCGRYCQNKGTNFLMIKYVNKNGWFCESCKKDLEKYGLINPENGLL